MGVDEWTPLRTLAVYTALTYAVSWPCWAVRAAAADLPGLVRTGLFVLGGLGPLLVGLALSWLSGRHRAWLGRVFRLRVPRRYYVAALVLPVVAALVAGAVHALAFGGTLTPEALPAPVEYPVYLGFVTLLGGGLEEPGWRGYLLARLQAEYTALTAALAVGVVWAGWHAPLFVLPDTVQGDLVPSLYVGQLLAMSVVLAWVTNAAGGSVVPAALLHAGGNAVVNYYPAGGAAGVASPTGLGLLTATLVVTALVLVGYYGPEHLAPADVDGVVTDPGD